MMHLVQTLAVFLPFLSNALSPNLTLGGYEPSVYVLDFPKYDNPMRITVAQPYSKNYFMMIGDWGAASSESTYIRVQQAVASKMNAYYQAQKAKGMNLLFVAAVGDNFYWTGQNCYEWQNEWESMYGSALTSVPWLAVKGNHDWGDSDPTALCPWNAGVRYTSSSGIPYAGNQLNKDKGGCNPDKFYLPDFGYYYTINELDFELIALDENDSDCPNGLGGSGSNGASKAFSYCGGSSAACRYLSKMKTASEEMMEQRARNSSNRNFFIINHYPGIGTDLVKKFVSARLSGSYPSNLDYEQIVSAYGHTHSQECKATSSNSNGELCYSILTGGGGGCCGENTRRGFYVMHFDDDKVMKQPLSIDDDQLSCKYPCGATELLEGSLKEKIYWDTCCHTIDDPQCEGFDISQCDHDDL